MASRTGNSSLNASQKKALKAFGLILRQEREKKNWVLEDVIEHGYPSWQHWQAVESGLKNISFTTLLGIAKTLKKHPADLLKQLAI